MRVMRRSIGWKERYKGSTKRHYGNSIKMRKLVIQIPVRVNLIKSKQSVVFVELRTIIG